jgi:signal peptidase I
LNTNQENFLELSQEILERGSLLRFRAHGRSMYPFINNGNIIIVEPLNGHSVNIGDIVFYRRSGNSLTAHRLIRINGRRGDNTVLLTKGDSLGYTDPLIPPEQVMGRVIRIEDTRKQLMLKSWHGRMFGFLIAWFARGRYLNQDRVVRNLGRLAWFFGGRRTA